MTWRHWTFVGVLIAIMFSRLAWGHGDLAYPAKYQNATGTPCCTIADEGPGDCLRISDDLAQSLLMDELVTIEFPSGTRTTRINAIYESEELSAVACSTGCLFRQTRY